jgi:hypothetical protein
MEAKLSIQAPQRKTIRIKTFEKNHVLDHDRVLFNVNNIYDRFQPLDYKEVLSKGNTQFWVDHFHKADSYHTIVINGQDLKWMREAQKIGYHTKKCSDIYVEELEESAAKLQPQMPEGKWFVRTEKVSLKQGCHGVGPYSSMKAVIESLVSSTSSHACFEEDDEEIKLYFLPWLNMKGEKEFRIFVYQNEITGISSQHLYTANQWLQGMDEDQLTNIVNMILDYFNRSIRDRLSYMGSYTMDLVILENGSPYFIEPNSFGKTYAAGSSLFHWVHDEELLSTHSDVIEVRYTV